MTGQKVIFMVRDNGGYAVINRLQVNTGGAEFNNLLRTTRHERYVQVDLVKHAESMAPSPNGVEGVDDLTAAFARAKAADRSYVIVVPIDQYTWTEGGAWWEVGVPEVSEAGGPRPRGQGGEEAEPARRRPTQVGEFDGKVVVITGAASFVGEAIGCDPRSPTARVVLGDRDADHGEAAARGSATARASSRPTCRRTPTSTGDRPAVDTHGQLDGAVGATADFEDERLASRARSGIECSTPMSRQRRCSPRRLPRR